MPILPKSRTQSEISAVVKLLTSASEMLDSAVANQNERECRSIIETAIKRLRRHGERLE